MGVEYDMTRSRQEVCSTNYIEAQTRDLGVGQKQQFTLESLTASQFPGYFVPDFCLLHPFRSIAN